MPFRSFQSGDHGDSSIHKYSLGTLSRQLRKSQGGFLKEEPLSHGFGEWEKLRQGFSPGKRWSEIILFFLCVCVFNPGLLLILTQDAAIGVCVGWGGGLGDRR